MSNNEMLDIEGFAQFTGYSKSYVYKLIHNQTIPFSKPLGKIFFRKSDVIAFMQSNRINAVR